MKDKQRKKAQRKINKRVAILNKNLLNDNLWRGRFFIRQTDANWERFEDGSGGLLKVWLGTSPFSYLSQWICFIVLQRKQYPAPQRGW